MKKQLTIRKNILLKQSRIILILGIIINSFLMFQSCNNSNELNDGKKSRDEITYENLKEYLHEKNLELCSFYKRWGDIELSCIREADKKFPDYGFEHLEYAEMLMKQEQEKLTEKYNLDDSIFSQVSVFAIGYCK